MFRFLNIFFDYFYITLVRHLLGVFEAEPGEGFFLVVEEFDAGASILGDVCEKSGHFIRFVFLNADGHRQSRNIFRCKRA